MYYLFRFISNYFFALLWVDTYIYKSDAVRGGRADSDSAEPAMAAIQDQEFMVFLPYLV